MSAYLDTYVSSFVQIYAVSITIRIVVNELFCKSEI